MKKITYKQFLEFEPCYLEDPGKRELMDSIAARRGRWSALDILALDEIPPADRLWAVLREKLIDAPILHELACRCAERALSRVENPDPRSLRAIEIKRAWLRGKATDEELVLAESAALDAARAARHATRAAAEAAALDSAEAAAESAALDAARAARHATRAAAEAAALDSAEAAAESAALDAALAAAWAAARYAARAAAEDAAFIAGYYMCRDHEFERQAEDLKGMLEATAQ